MAIDYKKAQKELYLPSGTPSLIEIPPMNYICVRGVGNPNTEGGQYKSSIELLYGTAFTIKMSPKAGYRIDGYFEYVVPPLEGLWWTDNGVIDYGKKEDFHFISMIRLPEFATREVFDWAVKEATAKKKKDFSSVEFFHYEEGLCVQCMHTGPYDSEPATIKSMVDFALSKGYLFDLEGERKHHEIYLSDPRRTAPEKIKTVIRYPLKKK